MYDVYLVVERGLGKNDIIEDLNLLGSHICSRKEEIYYKDNRTHYTISQSTV